MKKILLLLLFPVLLNAQTTTIVLQPGSEGKDALVMTDYRGNFATNNYGDSSDLNSNIYGYNYHQRSLIQFDLSSIPSGAAIISATLTLYANGQGHYNGNWYDNNASYLKRVTTAWDEDIVNWANQPATSPGGLYLPRSVYANQNYVLEVSSAISDMYLHPASNHGFMLQLIKEEIALAGLLFASGDHPNAALHPKLEITYQMGDKYFVPDPAFRAALKTLYPTCFNGDSLLTQNAIADSRNSLNVIGRGISSLEGIQWFRQLEKLYCGNNNLTTLPPLPYNITILDASRNCFCGSVPGKPININAGNWKIEPNKSSCLPHITLVETDYITKANQPITMKVGKSLSFDGVDDFYSIPGLPSLTGPFTIEYWANPKVTPTQLAYPELNGIANQWNHFAMIKTAANSPLQVYLNGELRVTNNAVTTATLTGLLIGHGSNLYKGQMTDLRIWKTIRTRAELKTSLYGFVSEKHGDLIGFWKMNAHSGSLLKDYSGQGLTGTISGAMWITENSTHTFEWTPGTNLSSIVGSNTTFTSSEEGIYNYVVTATNSKGCKVSKNVNVNVQNTNPCKVHVTVPETEYFTKLDTAVVLKIGRTVLLDGRYSQLSNIADRYAPFTVEYWMKPSDLPLSLKFPELQGIVGEWNHVGITCPSLNGTLNVYVNGRLAAVRENNSKSMMYYVPTRIAEEYDENTEKRDRGLLNDLKLWKSIRTPQDLKASMFNFEDYKNPDLLGAWKMNENKGGDLRNLGGNHKYSWIYGSLVPEGSNLTYSWTPSANLYGQSGGDINFKTSTEGEYTYTVTATDERGCKASQKVKVRATNLVKPGTDFAHPIYFGLLDSVTRYTNTQNNSKLRGFKNDYGVRGDDIFYKFTVSSSAVVTVNH